MTNEMIERWQDAFGAWRRFISGAARLKHISIVVDLSINGPSTLADLSKRFNRAPESVRNDLNKLGDTDSHGKAGDRLVEKVRFEDRKGLYFQLSARGHLAIEEVEAALKEQEEPDFYSFADEDDGGMMGGWLNSRSFVRG
ncbi:hypothetical protein [Novosphingobium sp. TCA1]|uniref:hypothetical protein n=1 Tax=Novosphingobium sp. TCA1 TaxID=2682474 RepID=UPI001307D8B7|nr:hypothetical protein [Novosphingobium sp. TCA1]GFE75186.1 hypothetical protein NTCA1_28350 [Novosphingobium sp. TCA1]